MLYVVLIYIIVKRGNLSRENRVLNILIIADAVAACKEFREYIKK